MCGRLEIVDRRDDHALISAAGHHRHPSRCHRTTIERRPATRTRGGRTEAQESRTAAQDVPVIPLACGPARRPALCRTLPRTMLVQWKHSSYSGSGGGAGIRTRNTRFSKFMMAKDFWQQVFTGHHVPAVRSCLPSPGVPPNRPQSWQHCGNAPLQWEGQPQQASNPPVKSLTLVLYLVGSSVPWLGPNDAGTRHSTADKIVVRCCDLSAEVFSSMFESAAAIGCGSSGG